MLILGRINEDYLRELLTTMGDRFTDEQVDDMFREAPINQKTNDFNYVEVSGHFFKTSPIGWFYSKKIGNKSNSGKNVTQYRPPGVFSLSLYLCNETFSL